MRFVPQSVAAAAVVSAFGLSAQAGTVLTFDITHDVNNGVASYGVLPAVATDNFTSAAVVSPGWDFYASTDGGGWSTSFSTPGELVTAMAGGWTLTDADTSNTYTINVDASAILSAFRELSLTTGSSYDANPSFAWSVSGTGVAPLGEGDLAELSFREVNDAVNILGAASYPEQHWTPDGGPFADGFYEVSISYLTSGNGVLVSSPDLTGSLSATTNVRDTSTSQVMISVPEPAALLPLLAGTALLRRRGNRR